MRDAHAVCGGEAAMIHWVADDFGLSDRVNQGIVESFEKGVLTSAALLTAAPASEPAARYAVGRTDLELGIHLALVESWSLNVDGHSLHDHLDYFGPSSRPCLHRHWTSFVKRYFLGRISKSELKREFILQCERFVQLTGRTPAFLNATQHLHLLPGIQDLVLDVVKMFNVPVVRSLHSQVDLPDIAERRWIQAHLLGWLSGSFAKKARGLGIAVSEQIFGFRDSGHMTTALFHAAQDKLKKSDREDEWLEIMAHPGLDDPKLRVALPWAYTDFDWEGECRALQDSSLGG